MDRNLWTVLGMAALAVGCSSEADAPPGEELPGLVSGTGGGANPAGTGGASAGATGSSGGTPGNTGGAVGTASGGSAGATGGGNGGAPTASGGSAGTTTSSGGSAGYSGAPSGGASGSGNPGAGGATPTGGIHHEDNPTAATAGANGPFKIASYTAGLPDSPDYGTATVVYPTDATPPLAGIAAVPGYQSPGSVMKGWSDLLATHGFAVIWVETNALGDQPPARAKALLSAVSTLKGEQARQGSPLAGKLDASRMGVMGHSMGGGGTLIAETQDSTLRAGMPLAPWCTGTGCAFQSVKVPTMIFTAQNDTTAAPARHGNVFYGQIPTSTPKILAEIAGGNHGTPFSVTGNPGMKSVGVSFMKVYLDGDERYRPFLQKAADFSKYESSP